MSPRLALTSVLLLSSLLSALACDRRPTPAPAPSASASAGDGPSLLTPAAYQLALRDIRAAAGQEIQALELAVHHDHVVLQARDPQQPERVLQYEYKQGKVAEPIAVRLSVTGKLEDNLFPLQDVALSELPRLAREAVAELDPENGKVDYVLVRRNLPHTMDVQFRVYVDSPAKDGYIDADAEGRLLGR